MHESPSQPLFFPICNAKQPVLVILPLVQPMLARSGRLPAAGDYAYELKWDGFRALVSTVGRLRVLSRQWWEMTPRM
jgi:ATP-dependent DNA ligase